MPRFTIDGTDLDPLDIESDNWMSALGEALGQLGVGDADTAGVEADVQSDGDILVRSAAGQFTIHEVVETIARIRVGPATRASTAPEGRLDSLFDFPVSTTSPLDAPDPTDSPSYQARAESADIILQEITTRCPGIFASRTGADAARSALDLLMEYIPAESAAVLYVEEPAGGLLFVAARGPRAAQLIGQRVPSGKGIAGLAVRSGVALTVREAKKDTRHFGEVDQKTGYETRAILSVPIRARGRNVGCIELLNPFAGTDFTSWHQSATQAVATQLGLRAP